MIIYPLVITYVITNYTFVITFLQINSMSKLKSMRLRRGIFRPAGRNWPAIAASQGLIQLPGAIAE
jgi:hypothetical protein